MATQAKKKALSDTILLVFIKKRTITCILYLREQSLLFKKYTYKFTSLRDLIKYFKQKYLV